MDPQHQPYPIAQSVSKSNSATVSPDGHWLAFASDESGLPEVYVTPFPKPGGRQRISIGGGMFLRWRHDGRELFFLSPDGHLMSTTIASDGVTLTATKPDAVFQANVTPFETA